ncbi:MAG: glycosyltransferase family 2 protein, partial [Eubacterium sp.]|nr:glycosyltransferase family 2 protein [Eubacterium sp.]
MNKKLISIAVPVYNEEAMLDEVYSRTASVMEGLAGYDYEIVFFDDGSTDGSRAKIEELCEKDERVKAVFYNRNFGYSKSIYYAARETKGDCTVLLHCDLQNPPEVIPEFVKKWEEGHDVVLGVKNKSRENPFMYFMRTVFYFLMRVFFGVKLIPHATEFELFDKSFTDILKKTDYPNPFLRGIVLEYARNIDRVYFVQDKRKKGKSKFNLSKYYDFAICGIVNCSTKLPRRMILLSLIGGVIAAAELVFNFIPDYIHGYVLRLSNGLILRGIVFLILILIIFIS